MLAETPHTKDVHALAALPPTEKERIKFITAGLDKNLVAF